VTDNKNVLLAFKFHYDRLQPYNNIAIGFSTTIAVIEFVVITICKIIGVFTLKTYLVWQCLPDALKHYPDLLSSRKRSALLTG